MRSRLLQDRRHGSSINRPRRVRSLWVQLPLRRPGPQEFGVERRVVDVVPAVLGQRDQWPGAAER